MTAAIVDNDGKNEGERRVGEGLVAALQAICVEATANREAVLSLVDGLTGDQMRWRERPNRWSVAENLDHLSRTVSLCAPAVEKAVAEAERTGKRSDGPFTNGLMGRLFVWYVEPPPKIRLPAPPALRPFGEGDLVNALPEYLRSHASMLEKVRGANGVDLRRARFQSPFASIVRMDLLALFSVWTAHERRHLHQMRTSLRMMRARG